MKFTRVDQIVASGLGVEVIEDEEIVLKKQSRFDTLEYDQELGRTLVDLTKKDRLITSMRRIIAASATLNAAALMFLTYWFLLRSK